MPRSAYAAVFADAELPADSDEIPTSPRVRRRRAAQLGSSNGHVPNGLRPRVVPNPASTASPAVAQRRVRVALLVEEEGLERGAIARIAGWLDVSPSTIGRDIRALIAAGDPVVTGAAVRAQRRRSGNGR